MGDWIGLGVIMLVLAGSLWGLSYLGKTREPMSEEEFERRAAEARGTMSAGVVGLMYALQKLMNPKAAEAVEVQKDLKAGCYNAEYGESGDDLDGDERVGDEPVARRKKDAEPSVEEEDDDEEGKDDA
ncbi:MAG TPA: hypothetical protein VF064_20980 [Pyrinomonadaceae bacterium]